MRWPRRLALLAAAIVLVTVLAFTVSPWPSALLVRHVFSDGGERTAKSLESRVPDGVVSRLDLDYGPELLDVYRPENADGPLPTVVWVHGGGWIGGDKTDVRPYLKILAAEGYTVVGVDYTRAPAARHPTPVRQAGAALSWLGERAHELGMDPDRVVLAGDSAGAQIVAQLAAAVTDERYARALDVEPGLSASALRGVVLNCGAYDPGAIAEGGSRLIGFLARRTVRSYLGDDWQAEAALARVRDHVTGFFPRTWITVGNDDTLEDQGRSLATRLEELGVDVTSLFYPPGHRPLLGHEYQFNLDGEDGRAALRDTIGFLDQVLNPGTAARG